MVVLPTMRTHHVVPQLGDASAAGSQLQEHMVHPFSGVAYVLCQEAQLCCLYIRLHHTLACMSGSGLLATRGSTLLIQQCFGLFYINYTCSCSLLKEKKRFFFFQVNLYRIFQIRSVFLCVLFICFIICCHCMAMQSEVSQ